MATLRRELIEKITEAGFVFKRTGRGDHEIWWNPSTGVTIVVDGGINSRHTANAVLKQAGLKKEF